MTPQPTVSVCIPSYNHAPYLSRTLDSVLAQTYRDFEVIVVDDGSTDDSLQIAEAYRDRHPDKIRVYTHPGHANRGVSATANLGIEQARGRYWAGVPSDDLLVSDRLARQVCFMDDNPNVGLVYGYAAWVGPDDEMLPERPPLGQDVNRFASPVERLIQINTIPGMSVMARRDCFESIGAHDENLTYSDWELWVRFANSFPLAFLPEVFALYRVHGSNLSIGSELASRRDHQIAVTRTLLAHSESADGELAQSRTRALLLLQLAFLEFTRGATRIAREHLARAFDRDPTLYQDDRFLGRWLLDRQLDDVQPARDRGLYEQSAATAQRFARNAATLDTVDTLPLWFLAEVRDLGRPDVARRLASKAAACLLGSAVLAETATTPALTERALALRALRLWPGVVQNEKLVIPILSALFGPSAVTLARRARRRFRGSPEVVPCPGG